MGFFETYRLNAAAKRYARMLPAQIKKDYGASEFYTSAQIAAAVRRAKLPEAFIAFALAKYLPREVFDNDVETEFSYDLLYDKFKSYLRRLPSQQIGAVGENADAITGWYVGGDGGGGSG